MYINTKLKNKLILEVNCVHARPWDNLIALRNAAGHAHNVQCNFSIVETYATHVNSLL